MNNVTVSVLMITYNHENFIREAIEGILMQKTDFSIELVIGEDCSTDSTRKIVSEYAEKYPEIIRPLLPDKNLGMMKNFIETMQAAKGKYIALCEGDDYWTDPNKLQKQVDFLEANEDYSVCFHRYKIYDNQTNKFRIDGCEHMFKGLNLTGVDFCTKDFFDNWITQPLTMVFVKDSFNLNLCIRYKYFRDTHLIFHLLQNGKAYLFSFDGGIYREHAGGIHSKQSLIHQCDIGVAVAKELYYYNKKNVLLKNNYLKLLEWSIYTYKKNQWNTKILIINIYNYFVVSKSIKKLIKQVLK